MQCVPCLTDAVNSPPQTKSWLLASVLRAARIGPARKLLRPRIAVLGPILYAHWELLILPSRFLARWLPHATLHLPEAAPQQDSSTPLSGHGHV